MRWAWEWDLHIFKEEKEANCRLWKCEKRNTRENFQSEVCDSFCDRKKCKLIWPNRMYILIDFPCIIISKNRVQSSKY